MFEQLIRPFAFLGVRHPDALLDWVRWWLPLLLGGIFSVALLAVPCVDIYSNSGLFSKLLSFVQSLPGFYLAALAAISTFTSTSMDRLMPGVPPKGKVLYNGALQEVQLTRRRMLCMLFAYLTALSFGLTMALILATSFAAPLARMLPDGVQWMLRAGGTFFIALLLMQMLSVTLWGLFYIGERVHTPDGSSDESSN